MTRIRSLAFSCAGLALGLVLACQDPPPPTTDPSEAEVASAPAVFTEQGAAEIPEPNEPDEVPPIAAGTCPGATAYVPTPYFDEQLLIRLPEGVDEAALVEVSPGLVRTSAPVTWMSCDEATPSVAIDFIGLTLLPDDPAMSLSRLRGLTLQAMGYPAKASTLVEGIERGGREGAWVYEVPGTASADEPARVLLAFKAVHGRIAALVFQVEPELWPLIVDTLVESSDKLSLMPPAS